MEKNSRFHAGMFVTIPYKLINTENTCGCSFTMQSMSGNRIKIESVYDSGKLSIGSFIWDPRDFKLPSSTQKKIPITYFDPEELVI